MARSLRGSNRVNVAPRRRTGWSLGPGDVGAGSFTSSSSQVLGLGAAAQGDGLTVARIRGEFMAYLHAAAAINDGYVGAVGIGLTTQSAFAIGITAVPTPITDLDWDGWLWHSFFALKSGGVIAAAVAGDQLQVNDTAAAVRLPVDTKAMRKITSEGLIYAAAEVTESGTASMRIHFNSRMLSMLP